MALKFITGPLDIKLVDVEVEQIINGNEKIIFEILYKLFLKFNVNSIQKDGKVGKEALLLWLNIQVIGYSGAEVATLSTESFKNGKTFQALCDSLISDTLIFDYNQAVTENEEKNLQLAFDIAEEHLSIPKLLSPLELINGRVDERSLICTLSYYFHKTQEVLDQRKRKTKVQSLEEEVDLKLKLIDDTVAELEQLRKELEHEKITVPPNQIWDQYLVNPSQETPQITIPFYVKEGSGRKIFVMYHIRVSLLGKIWVFKKRYSEFYTLDQKLMKLFGKNEISVQLPPKKAIGNLEIAYIEFRKKKLELYLQSLIRNQMIIKSPIFSNFISKDSITTLIDVEAFKKQQIELYSQQKAGILSDNEEDFDSES